LSVMTTSVKTESLVTTVVTVSQMTQPSSKHTYQISRILNEEVSQMTVSQMTQPSSFIQHLRIRDIW
jgi:hypothetical protein